MLCIVLSICCMLAMFGCEKKVEVFDGTIGKETPGKGTVTLRLNIDPEPEHDAYLIQFFDTKDEMMRGVLELYRDAGFTDTRELPVGTYTIELATYDSDRGFVLDMKEEYVIEVKENGTIDMVIEAYDREGENWYDDPHWGDDPVYESGATFGVEFKDSITEIYVVRVENVTDANDVRLFEISSKTGWSTDFVEIPMGEYKVSVHEKLEDGDLGEPVEFIESHNICMNDEVKYAHWFAMPIDENLLADEYVDDDNSGSISMAIAVPDGFEDDVVVRLRRDSDGETFDIRFIKDMSYHKTVDLSLDEYSVELVFVERNGELKVDWSFKTGYKFSLQHNRIEHFEIEQGMPVVIHGLESDDEQNSEFNKLFEPRTREYFESRVKELFGEDVELSDEEYDDLIQIENEDVDDKNAAYLTHIVKLAMGNQRVYDAMFLYQCNGNVDSYVVGKDGEPYHVDGNVRGVTLTFQPEKIGDKCGYVLSNGIINKFVREDNAKYINKDTILISSNRADVKPTHMMKPNYEDCGQIGSIVSDKEKVSYLYEAIASKFGDYIELYSDAYMNCEYTVFITFGSEITVYGSFNGYHVN